MAAGSNRVLARRVADESHASDADKKFDELVGELERLAEEHQRELERVERNLADADKAVDLSDLKQEAAERAADLRQKTAPLPQFGEDPNSARAAAALGREHAQSMAQSLARLSLKDAVESGRHARSELAEAAKLRKNSNTFEAVDEATLAEARAELDRALSLAENSLSRAEKSASEKAQAGLQDSSGRERSLSDRAANLAGRGNHGEISLPEDLADALGKAEGLMRDAAKELGVGHGESRLVPAARRAAPTRTDQQRPEWLRRRRRQGAAATIAAGVAALEGQADAHRSGRPARRRRPRRRLPAARDGGLEQARQRAALGRRASLRRRAAAMMRGLCARIALSLICVGSAAVAFDLGLPSPLERVANAITEIDTQRATELLSKIPVESAGLTLERARLAVYLGECDRAEAILSNPLLSESREGASLAELAKSCARATAAGFVLEDKQRGVWLRLQDDADRALAPFIFEVAAEARDTVSKEVGIDLPRPLRIDLVRDLFSLSSVSGLPLKAAETTGTLAVARWGRVIMLSPRAPVQGYPWQDTLAHEITHLLVTRATRDFAPLWMQEGLAKRFEVRWRPARPFDRPIGRTPARATPRSMGARSASTSSVRRSRCCRRRKPRASPSPRSRASCIFSSRKMASPR